MDESTKRKVRASVKAPREEEQEVDITGALEWPSSNVPDYPDVAKSALARFREKLKAELAEERQKHGRGARINVSR